MKNLVNDKNIGFSYDPFGMITVGRSWEVGSEYRYGFNSQEQDNDIGDKGNLNTAEFWEYDTRLGRRWNIDPKLIVGQSSYGTFLNCPILNPDFDGDIVEYEKLRDRIIVGWNKLTNKTFRQNYNNWNNNPSNTYTFKKRTNNQRLPNAAPNGNNDILYSTDGSGGGKIQLSWEKKTLRTKRMEYVIVGDNNDDNQPIEITLDRVVPETTMIIDPLDHPDQITLSSDGTQIYQETLVYPVKDQASFVAYPEFGYDPVLDVRNDAELKEYDIPSNVTTITLRQESMDNWDYIDKKGNLKNHEDEDSYWKVGYWRYKKFNLNITFIVPKIKL